MKTVSHSITLPMPAMKAWEIVSDVKNYPKSLKFIKRITIKSALVLGGEWEDYHTIAFIPLNTNHKIIALNKPHLLIYELDLPFNWEMKEKIEIKQLKATSKVTITIDYNLKNKFIMATLGKILEYRLSQVIQSGFEYYKSQNSKAF